MTTLAQIAGGPANVESVRRPWAATMSDRVAFPVCIAGLLFIFLLLFNPYWVPGGDSEVYTAIARSLALGQGYKFNGHPVAMLPPGWPRFLAAVMWISPTFTVLKLATMSCMLGSLAISYWICRRFASPGLSMLAILLTGILSHVYSLTFWLHSDALFCLVSSAAVLVAMQISEGKTSAVRAIGLIVLCAGSVYVRWAGLLTWLIVAVVLLEGEIKPRWNDRWFRAVSTGVITVLVFLLIRALLWVPPQEEAKARAFGGASEEVSQTEFVANTDATVATTYSLFNPSNRGVDGLMGRALGWGRWFSFLLWQPLRMAQSSGAISALALISGSIVLIPLLVQAIGAARSRQWIWGGMLVYSFALAMNWPHPNARYLVPIAPLIILAVFLGMRTIRSWMSRPQFARACTVLTGYFVATVVLCNGALWGVEVWAARSSEFYDTYEAGMTRDLISAARWLNAAGVKDGEVSISWRYVNMNRPRYSPTGLRYLNLLTNSSIVRVPDSYIRAGDPRRRKVMLNWGAAVGVRYVLYQPDVSPWRIFHFRVPWLQEMMTGEPAVDSGAGWRLYVIPSTRLDGVFRTVGYRAWDPDTAIRVTLKPEEGWPTRVPGM